MAVTVTTSPDKEFLDRFISLLARSYLTTSLTTAFITEIDGIDGSAQRSSVITTERLTKHFTLGVTAAARSNVLILSSPSFSAAALWEPPDFCGVPPAQARRNPGPILQEFRDSAKKLKAKYLALPDEGEHSYDQPAAPSQGSGAPSDDPYPTDFNKDIDFETRPFYHLGVMGRDPDVPAEESWAGLKSIFEEILSRAKKEEVPIWLETASEEARDQYETLGFRVCEEVVIGGGRVGADGWPKKGGEGVKSWAMIWDSHLN